MNLINNLTNEQLFYGGCIILGLGLLIYYRITKNKNKDKEIERLDDFHEYD